MNKRTKTIVRILIVLGIVVTAVAVGTIGVFRWRTLANYPPPIEHPSVRGWISFVGLEKDRMGLVLWLADGSGPEPAASGHTIPMSESLIRAPYYMASPDFRRIDPQAFGCMKGKEPVSGFIEFMKTLYESGYRIEDVSVTFPLFTLGEDKEGEDWVYQNGVETRFLKTNESIQIRLKSECLMSLTVNRFTWIEDYREHPDSSESVISGMTDEVIPRDASQKSSASVQSAARSFLSDVDAFRVRLVFEEIRPDDRKFSGNGRMDARFVEVRRARLEIVP
jgi:hypothetical protein